MYVQMGKVYWIYFIIRVHGIFGSKKHAWCQAEGMYMQSGTELLNSDSVLRISSACLAVYCCEVSGKLVTVLFFQRLTGTLCALLGVFNQLLHVGRRAD